MLEEWLIRFRDEALAMARDLLPRAFLALLIILIGIAVARLARKWVANALDRSRIRNDTLLRDFFARATSISIIVLATLSALGQIGWDIRTFLTGLGVTGIIIGFALRDTLSNFAAGLLLLIYRPFRAGEFIELEGSQGTVKELTIVNMQMTTSDGVRVIMPNSKVWGAKIINYSMSERRRIELTVKVPDENSDLAIRTILASLKEDPRVLLEPAPSVQVSALSEKTATLRIFAWTKPNDLQSAAGDLYLKIHSALRKQNITLI